MLYLNPEMFLGLLILRTRLCSWACHTLSIARIHPLMLLSSGADLSHPPPGSRRGIDGYPSFTALVGSIDGSGTRYCSRMGVQDSLQEVIEDMKNMCVVCDCALHRSKNHDS